MHYFVCVSFVSSKSSSPFVHVQVSGEDIVQAAQIVRAGMEEAVTLAVPTPVRLQVGASWGTLQEFHL